MKKLNFLVILLCLLAINGCKKDPKENARSGASKNVASKLIGSGNSTMSGCSYPVIATKNIKVDFGAVGNGTTDDSKAFLKAAAWINANWSATGTIKLYIPNGLYLVGVQLAPGASYNYGTGILTNPSTGASYQGYDMLALNNVQNVTIYGDPGSVSKIQYKNGLFFGGMNPPPPISSGNPCNWTSPASACSSCGTGADNATVGSFITLNSCNCVIIDQLVVLGNVQNCVLKGYYGDCASYQLAYDGINIINGSNITVSNTSLVNFGRDGLMSRYTTSNPNNITLTNVSSLGNCRQGFSFTAGNNIVATNCSFNNTGTFFNSDPASGMDIEPENGGTCTNSSFTNCQFLDNFSRGIISDNNYPNVSNITFTGCKFRATGPGSWSVWAERMINTSFNNCTVIGQMTHISGTSGTDHMTFNSCHISDWNGSLTSPVSGWANYLLNFGASAPLDHYYTFSNCRFDIHRSLLIYTVPSGMSYADRLFQNDTFMFHYNDMRSYPTLPAPFLGYFINTTLNSNVINETAPQVYPLDSAMYYVGIVPTGWSPSYDNTVNGLNTCAPQNGIGGNPYTRVCYNPMYPCCVQYYWVNF